MSGRNERVDGRAAGGFSMIELTVVCAIMAVIMVIALPQLVSTRRAMRATAIPTEVKAQLRYARQMAMSRQRAVTFQYKTDTCEVNVIQHNADYPITGGTTKVGTPVLNDTAYPTTAGATVLREIKLAVGGMTTEDIAYGRPENAPTDPLDDTTNLTAPVNGQINITFQPDGTVIDAGGAPANFALMFYNPAYPEGTGRAVSVLGAAGRIKVWRYNDETHGFVE